MNPTRRPLLYAAGTFAAVILFLILYWAAAAKKVVPGLNTPLREALGLAVATNAVAPTNPPVTHVRAKPVEVSQPAPAPTQPSQTGQSAKPTVSAPDAKTESARLAKEDSPPTNSVSKATTNTVSTTRKSAPALPVPDQTPEDERVARRWLQEANMRPVVRIRYDAADILQLIEQRRGLLVVSGGDATNRRELYLATSENKAPLFEKLTPSVASRFSSYSLALNASPAFATFAGPLPAYFPTGEVELSFVPENELATIVFSSVAAASRALPKEFVASNRVVFEGQLRLNGVQPVFELLEARVGTNRHVFSRAQTAEVR